MNKYLLLTQSSPKLSNYRIKRKRMAAIASFVFNPFEENTYLVYQEKKDCIIIDPGCSNEKEQNILVDFITVHQLSPVLLINTHGHADHIMGNQFINRQYGLLPAIHQADEFLLKGAPEQGKMFGIHIEPSPLPGQYLHHEEMIHLGGQKLSIMHTPGHSPGGVSIVSEADKWVIAGDTLFNMSIGRTDLPGGDYHQLIKMIQTRLFSLAADFVVYCGHGPETTIGFEKMNNPFLI